VPDGIVNPCESSCFPLHGREAVTGATGQGAAGQRAPLTHANVAGRDQPREQFTRAQGTQFPRRGRANSSSEVPLLSFVIRYPQRTRGRETGVFLNVAAPLSLGRETPTAKHAENFKATFIERAPGRQREGGGGGDAARRWCPALTSCAASSRGSPGRSRCTSWTCRPGRSRTLGNPPRCRCCSPGCS